MSQFLIAILCGSFDDVREKEREQAEKDSIPTGYITLASNSLFVTPGITSGQSMWEFFLNLFRWNYDVCGMSGHTLCDIVTQAEASISLVSVEAFQHSESTFHDVLIH